jgi:hypothetical protein
LTDEKESLSMKGRVDTKGLLSILVAKDIVPPGLAAEMEKGIEYHFPPDYDDYLESCCKGGTFMPLDDALTLQKILAGEKRMKVNITNPVHGDVHQVEFCPNWPANLVWLHQYDNFGSKFGQLPAFRTKDTDNIDSRLIWIMAALVTPIPLLWEATITSLISVDQWNGWLLAYCAKECFPHRRTRNSTKNNPFKKILTVPELGKKLFEQHCDEFNIGLIQELLHHIVPSVSVATCDEVVGGYVPDPECKVFIVTVPLGSEWHGDDFQPAPGVWDLRFLVTTRSTGIELGKWTGTVYSSHGLPCFPEFWKHARKNRHPTKCRHGIEHENANLLEICVVVFVKVTNPSSTARCDTYLKYIGGQNKVFCEKKQFSSHICSLQPKEQMFACP